MTCLGVDELEEESPLGDVQLCLKDGGDSGTELLVGVGVKATNGDQLTVSSWLLSPTKGNRDRALQHNHHILQKHVKPWLHILLDFGYELEKVFSEQRTRGNSSSYI